MMALECREVTIRYEAQLLPVLDGISFAVESGERVALVGLNGSGKTTLLGALVGLVPYMGEIAVCGLRLGRGNVREIRDRIGFLFNVPEDQLLFPKVIEDVAFGLLRRGVARDEALARARDVLARLGVAELAEWPVHHLSHGQKQRVALAGALLAEPPLLLLDEPTAGLDPPARRDLAALLAGLGASQLIATHDLDFADCACTRILLLEGGRLAAEAQDTRGVRERWALDAVGGR